MLLLQTVMMIIYAIPNIKNTFQTPIMNMTVKTQVTVAAYPALTEGEALINVKKKKVN